MNLTSFLRLDASTSTFSVAFASYAESHMCPKFAGFRWDGGSQSWKTTDPVHVARLATAQRSVVECVDATADAFDAIRPTLPDDLRDAVLVRVSSAPIDAKAAERERIAVERAAVEDQHAIERLAWIVERDRQAAGEETPTGAEVEILLRWNPETGFSVRYPANGWYASFLREYRLSYHRGVWRAPFASNVFNVAEQLRRNGEALPATFEAARELGREPLSEVPCMCIAPRLVVVSTEADEDMKRDAKTMLHLVGADARMIDAAYDACRILAADDTDHARRVNGVGFGKAHGDIGHRLAVLEPEFRTLYDDAFALKLARLHRKQLPADVAEAVGKAQT